MVGAILHPRNILKMKEFHLHHRCIVIFNLKGIAPRGPMAPSLEIRGEAHLETKSVNFRSFLGPSDQNKLYHTPLLS